MTNPLTRITRHIRENIQMHLIKLYTTLYTMVRELLETSMHVTRSQIKSDGGQPDVKRMKTSDVSCSVDEQDIHNCDLENNE